MSGQDHTHTHLENLFRALLRLHKALLDDECVYYERVHGRIASNGEFLQLVLGHAWFSWLRPLSQLVAKFDELGEEDESPDGPDSATLIASVQTLLTPSEEGTGFGKHYYDALQREPDVGLAHAAVRQLLR
jgi:hypothetical protein